jgi:hypothetical protein
VPSIETIANASCCDERTVMRRIRRLERDGWVTVRRKVLGGRGSVYFLSLERLQVQVNENSKRSRLWKDISRLLAAIGSGDGLSPGTGLLKFPVSAKTPKNSPQNGLFPSDKLSPEFLEPSDTLSPGEHDSEGEQGRKIGKTGVSEQDSVEKMSASAESGEFPGDKLSRDKCQKDHLTGDNSNPPFNAFNVVSTVASKGHPPTPRERGEKNSPVEIAAQGAGAADEAGERLASSWSLFKTRLKFGLRDAPVGLANRFSEIRKGQDDYDACFREWWLVRREDAEERVLLVTQAADPEATEAGIAKYKSRLVSEARGAFANARGRTFEFQVEPVARSLEIAASAAKPPESS